MIKQYLRNLSALLVAALVPLLMAPTSTQTSTPIFQSVRVGTGLSNPGTGSATLTGTLRVTPLTGHVSAGGTGIFSASATIPYSDLTGTPAIPASASPSASIGLGVINGAASTFMRSDAAPPLDQAIVPTWTGLHTFSNANLGIVVASTAASAPIFFTPSGQDGWRAGAGSINVNDWGLYNVTRSQSVLEVAGGASGGNVTINAPGSGVAATIKGAAAGATLSVNSPAGGATSAALFTGTGTAGNLINMSSTGGSIYLGLDNSTGNYTFSGSAAYAGFLGTTNATTFELGTNGVVRQTISSTGNVTINAASAGTTLNVTGTTNISGALTVTGTTNSIGAITQNGQAVCLANGTNCPAAATTGTWTPTWTGFSSGPAAVTASWTVTGNTVCVSIPGTIGPSNSTSMTITNYPTALQSLNDYHHGFFSPYDNGAALSAAGGITVVPFNVSSGVLTFASNATNGSWTAAGSKGLWTNADFCYYKT